MLNTNVHISRQGAFLVPDVDSVKIVAGNSITIHGDQDSDIQLCMADDTAALLGASPGGVKIAAGESASFQFSMNSNAGHGIVIEFAAKRCPATIPRGPGGVLSINSAKPRSSPGEGEPDNPPPAGGQGTEG